MKGKMMTKQQYYEHLEQENFRLKDELKELVTKHCDVREEMNSWMEGLQETIKELQEEKKKLQEENKKLQEEVEVLTESCDDWVGSYDEMKKQLDETEQKYQELNDAVENNYMTIEEHNEYYSDVKLEKEEAEKKYEDLNKIVSTFCNKKLGTLKDLMGSLLGWHYYGWSVEDCIDPENIGDSQ